MILFPPQKKSSAKICDWEKNPVMHGMLVFLRQNNNSSTVSKNLKVIWADGCTLSTFQTVL